MEFTVDIKISSLFEHEKNNFKFNPNEEKCWINLLKLRPFDITDIHCNVVESLIIINHSSDIHKKSEILY